MKNRVNQRGVVEGYISRQDNRLDLEKVHSLVL